MPLLDHFHPPLSPRRPWESFHAMWVASLVETLNQRLLPPEYYAEAQTHVGARVEIDVATYENTATVFSARQDASATATLPPQVWTPPTPPLVMPAVFPDTFEVRIFATDRGGLELVAAIELVSPGNKDRPQGRRTFAIKCASYLCQGISLILMDIVTSRQANLHNEMIRLLEAAGSLQMPADASLYAVAYRPILRKDKEEIDLWPATFAVGDKLPLLPLALSGILSVPVDFEIAYAEACRRLRLIA